MSGRSKDDDVCLVALGSSGMFQGLINGRLVDDGVKVSGYEASAPACSDCRCTGSGSVTSGDRLCALSRAHSIIQCREDEKTTTKQTRQISIIHEGISWRLTFTGD